MDAACIIGIQHVIGQIEYITIAWDGANVGEVLHTHYKTREQVLELIHGGSRPFLDGPDDILEEEEGEPPKLVRTHQDFFRIKEYEPQYYYLFTTDNSWVIYSVHMEPHLQHENRLYG